MLIRPYQPPVNIDDDVKDSERIRALQRIQDSPDVSTDFISDEITTLSSFIHMCRLRRLESRIHRQLYAADLDICFADGSHDHVIDNLKAELDAWQERIPNYNAAKSLDPHDYSVYHTREFFKIQHSKAVRLLLQPRITSRRRHHGRLDPATAKYLAICARAAGDICQFYKALHQRRPLGWNLLATHSIFTAGLTLLYCLWANREDVNVNLTLFDDIRSCSTVLFVVAERWPTVRRFRDVFEVLARKMFQIVSHDHARQPGPTPAPAPGTTIDTETPEDEEATRKAPAPEMTPSGQDNGNENTAFPSPSDEDFWTVFDDLVNDEYIRSQFRFEEADTMDLPFI